MEDCLFCKIVRGDIPSDRVIEDPDFVAFRDINPKARVHVLVVPRKHVASLNDLEVGDAAASRGAPVIEGGALLGFVVRVARALGIDDSGYRVVVNVGPWGGQEVPHLHFHILGGEKLGELR